MDAGRIDAEAGLAEGGLVEGGPAEAGPADAAPADAGEDAAACHRMPCALVPPQCGCASDEFCALDDDTAMPYCSSPPGTTGLNGLCGRSSECEPGLACVALFMSRPDRALCRPLCEQRSHCGGDYCLSFNSTAMIGFCPPSCDPLALTGCPGTTECRLYTAQEIEGRGGVVATGCAVPGGAPAGSPCGSSADCTAGTICLDLVCREVCRLPAGPCAVASCRAIPLPSTVGAPPFGACF